MSIVIFFWLENSREAKRGGKSLFCLFSWFSWKGCFKAIHAGKWGHLRFLSSLLCNFSVLSFVIGKLVNNLAGKNFTTPSKLWKIQSRLKLCQLRDCSKEAALIYIEISGKAISSISSFFLWIDGFRIEINSIENTNILAFNEILGYFS